MTNVTTRPIRPYLRRVGAALRRSRETSGIPQEIIAKKARMHRTYYSAIERGEKNITLHTLIRLGSIYAMTPASILVASEKEIT